MLRFIAIIFVLAQVNFANASEISMDSVVMRQSQLLDCGGMARLDRMDNGRLYLHLTDVRECSNFSINGYEIKMLEANGTRRGTVELVENYGVNQYRVEVYSNSRKHFDGITIRSLKNYPRPQPRPHADVYLNAYNRMGYLSSCGGTVEFNKVGSQVNLVFRHVAQCSNFDILSNDGETVEYPAKKIPGENGNRGGSFTIPQSIIDRGHNGVTILVKSNSGSHRNRVYIEFYSPRF